MTGCSAGAGEEGAALEMRVPSDDDTALAAALIRLFSLSDAVRSGIGRRGREWVAGHFDAASIERAVLTLYAEVARPKG